MREDGNVYVIVAKIHGDRHVAFNCYRDDSDARKEADRLFNEEGVLAKVRKLTLWARD